MRFLQRALFFCLVLVLAEGSAQSYQFVNYSVDDGLPSNEVYDVLQDSDGYMWFATDRGVARFDGYDFKVYTTKDGLHNNLIFYLKKDEEQRIWFSGMGDALSYYDPALDSIYCLPFKKNAKIRYPYDVEIKHTKNFKIVLTNIVSEYKFEREGDSLRFDGVDSLITEDFVDKLFVQADLDGDAEAFYGNYDTAQRTLKIGYKGVYKEIDVSEGSSKSKFQYLPLNDSVGILRNAVIAYWMENGKLTKWDELGSFYTRLTDPDMGIWLGTGQGLFHWSESKQRFEEMLQFQGNGVTSIRLDHQNGLWVTTRQSGIYLLVNPAIKHFTKDNGIYLDAVLKLCKYNASNGPQVVVTYLDNGVVTFIKGDELVHEHLKSEIEIQYVMPIDESFIAFSQATAGLTLFKEGKFHHNYRRNHNIVFYNKNDSFFWRLKNQKPSYWDGEELTAFDLPTNEVYGHPGERMVVYRDTLFSSGIYGLGYVDKNERWNQISLEPYKNIRVNDLHANDANYLAIATMGEGIMVKRGKRNLWVDESSGLTNDVCNNIYVDDLGEIWVGSNSGLSRIVLNQNNLTIAGIQNYSTVNGLLSNQVNDVVRVGDAVWVATSKGISILDLNRIPFNTSKSNPLHLEVKTNQNIEINCGADIPYEENLVFDFVSLDYQKTGSVTYLYRLVGLDDNWYETSYKSIRYSKLKEGNYEFQVKQLDGGKADVASFQFRVETPFWKAWWFLMLCLSLVWLLIWLRFRVVKNKSLLKVKLAEVKQQALASQMNPHFLFNSFNSIRSLIVLNQKEKAEHYLIKISELVRGVLNNSFEKAISLEDELQMLSRYLEIEQIRMVDGFEYSIDVEPPLMTNEIMIPPSVLQPYVENAILHGIKGLESRKGALAIKCKEDNSGQVVITIEDNGVGFDVNQVKNQSQKRGTNITAERLSLLKELFKQEVHIEVSSNWSGENSGTKVIISISRISN